VCTRRKTACVRHAGSSDCPLKPAQVRQALRLLDENSITYITLTEDVESVELYDAVLEIDADGAWSWRCA
jgi:hypothetical protein